MKSATRSLICTVILFLLAAPGWAQLIDTTRYSGLKTQLRDGGMALDVFNVGAKNNMMHLTGVQNYSGQNWRLSPTKPLVEGTTNSRNAVTAPRPTKRPQCLSNNERQSGYLPLVEFTSGRHVTLKRALFKLCKTWAMGREIDAE